jgi:hypothetical protein
MTRQKHPPLAHLLALLLMCSLFAAQWIGLQHRVAHAWLPSAHVLHIDPDRVSQETPDKNLFHSCVLLDAGTVGPCIASADDVPLSSKRLSLPVSVLPLVSWQALFTRHFSSRAPPFLRSF